jgi:Domain of unknown function (DUF4352)
LGPDALISFPAHALLIVEERLKEQKCRGDTFSRGDIARGVGTPYSNCGSDAPPLTSAMILIAVSAITLVLGLAACLADDTVTTAPEGGQEAGGAVQAARVGDTLTLSGFEEELQMAVRVQEVYDPAQPQGRFDRPESRTRYVAVGMTLENVGSDVYSDSPSNGAFLIDTEGQQFTTWLGPSWMIAKTLAPPRIAPADSRLGCVVFQVPEPVVPDRFQFTLESGFGPETGEWRLS